MSRYYDSDDNSLGHWEPCTEATYIELLADLGGTATVFAARTEVGESRSPNGYGPPYQNQDIYTEWGRRGSDAPLAACHDRWDSWMERSHNHFRFVATGVVGLSAAPEETQR